MGWRGIVAGVFGLIVLEVLVSNSRASGAVGGVFAGVGNAVAWLTDPAKPGIPQRATTSSASSASSGATPALTASQAVQAIPTPGGTGAGYNPNTLV